MNDKYSDFLRDKVIPLLKTKGKDYKQIDYGDYLTEMLNIKDIYKIFERCWVMITENYNIMTIFYITIIKIHLEI